MTTESSTTLGLPVAGDTDATLDARAASPVAAVPSTAQEVGRFRLDRLLGRGGMGQVWEAWDPQLERPVAIKRLLTVDLAARRRFMREARLQATIKHPGICPVFEVGQHAGEPYIVMPCLDGLPLDQAADGASIDYKLDLMRQVAVAVHAAHQEGLVHRDLKPANIVVEQPLDAPPRPVVLDFGIARPMDGESLTASGEIVGTPAYMAPEQVEGRSGQIDRRTDVYALGATLYRLVTGRPPHVGEGTPLLLRILRDEPERLPTADIPVEVEAIVFKCLEKEKSQRYPSARALAEDLGRYLAGEPVKARPITRWIRLGKWIRRHRLAVRVTTLASLVAMAALAWGGWSAWRSEERQEMARRFGAQVEEIEALARYSHLLPLHDVRDDRAQLRSRVEAIRPSLENRDPVVRALASHALGRGYLALDELEPAREFLQTAYELAPENSEIAADLGRTLSELYRERLTHLERFGDVAKRNAVGKQLSDQLAGTFDRAAELQEQWRVSLEEPALSLLRSGRSRPNEEAINLDALVVFHDGRPAEALELLASAPAAPSWRYERFRLEGDIRRSWAVTLHREGSAEAGAARHQLEAAREAYGRALAVAPSHAALLLDDAQALILLVRLGLVSLDEAGPWVDEARQRLHNARIVDPSGSDAWLWTVRVELIAADLATKQALDPTPHIEATLKLGQQALSFDPESSALAYELGRAHEQLARQLHARGEDPTAELGLAEEAFARVAPADRDYAFFTSLGILRMAVAEDRAERGLPADEAYDAAIEAYSSAAELHSKPFAALFNLGVTLFNSTYSRDGNRMAILNQAVEVFERAHRLRPESMEPFYQLGLSRQRQAQEATQDYRLVDPGLMALATADLRRAVEMAPEHFAPQIGLASAIRLQAYDAYNRGHEVAELLAGARAAHQRALQLAPDQSVALLNAGQVEFLAGKSALRQGLDPSQAASASEEYCRRTLEARYRANALHCLGDALSLQAEARLAQEDAESARQLVERAERFFEDALAEDAEHLSTLQSFADLLTVEARRLRLQGADPTAVLHQARLLLDRAFVVDDREITSSYAEARWYLEQATWLRTTGRDTESSVTAGRQCVNEILARVPESPEARRLDRRFAEFDKEPKRVHAGRQ